MSTNHFATVLAVVLVLPLSAISFAPAPRQSVNRDSASVTIKPPEATVHVGQTQTFEAVVVGTQSTAVRWAVQERNGGHITEDGIYTAPESIGIYHVVAVAMSNGQRSQTVVKVTVVTHYDTPPDS